MTPGTRHPGHVPEVPGADPVEDLVDEIVEAAHVLAALGLVTAFGHVSARADGGTVLITRALPLARVERADVTSVRLDATELPADAPPESWAHLAVYRGRPDVACVARGMPPSSFAVAASTAGSVRPLHGQGAWLGAEVPVHSRTRLLRTPELAAAAATTLGDASALLLRGNGALAVGATPGTAVARLWLVESLCRVHRDAPHGVPVDDEDVEAWQSAAPPLLERLWHYLREAAADAGHPARCRPLA